MSGQLGNLHETSEQWTVQSEGEGYLGQTGILPHEDLVLGVPVGGHQLAGVLRPGEITHLNMSCENLPLAVCRIT